jgi:CheY-like chemotaxis protein
MKGHLSIVDNNPVGTSVNCSIPIQQIAYIEDTRIAEPYKSDGLEHKKILIVEDNKVNRMVAEKILCNMKFDPVCVDSGEECIKAVKYEAEQQRNPVPIIALTANTSAEIRQECLTSGMSDYVAKPIKIDTLYEVMKRWL